MIEWEYLPIQTYWIESGRSGPDHSQGISYQHVWKPDLKNERPFLEVDAANHLGKAGWELVAMTQSDVSLVTWVVSGKAYNYSNFTTYLLMFKRPLQ